MFNLRAQSSTDVPVLLLNQRNKWVCAAFGVYVWFSGSWVPNRVVVERLFWQLATGFSGRCRCREVAVRGGSTAVSVKRRLRTIVFTMQMRTWHNRPIGFKPLSPSQRPLCIVLIIGIYFYWLEIHSGSLCGRESSNPKNNSPQSSF